MSGQVELFLGEPFQRERAVKARLRALRAAGLALHELEGAEAGPARLREALLAPSLLERGRVVRLRRLEELADPQALLALLERGLPLETHLLLEADKLDKRSALYKGLKRRGQLHLFEPPTRQGLPGALKRLLRERGVRLSPEAFQYLLGAVGPDLVRLAHEVDKLALYAQGRPLGLEDVQALVFGGPGAHVFAFLDACGERRAEALVLLEKLLAAGEEPSKLFFMLAGHVRSLLKLRALQAAGVAPEALAAATGLAPWLVRRRRGQVARWQQDELIAALHRLHETEVRIKRGRERPEDALVGLVLAWTGLTAARRR